MAVGDIYEVTDVQTFLGQQTLNVYFYRQDAPFVPLSGNTATALAEEWEASVLPAIAACQTNALTHVEVRARNLFDPTDAGSALSGVAGSLSSPDVLPAHDAYGLTLKHDNPSIRPGGKRISGVGEDRQTLGVPISAQVTLLNAAADAIAAPITGGLIITDDIMFPVVVKRINEGTTEAPEYRLPATSGEATVGLIIEALVNLLVTTQTSRKVGVGV